jgi:hypothetical protein
MVGVYDATKRDLAEIRKRDEGLADSALAASALALAAELDDATNSATSKSMCARALYDALDRLRELTPPDTERDGVDEVRQQRERRLADRGSAAADLPRT